MYTLKNEALTVSVIDPVAEKHHLGTRYCTGGYIYQVEDNARGPLLAGPSYPGAFSVFDGQGIPDAFNLQPLRESTATDARQLILGIGICDLSDNSTPEPCTWAVEQDAGEIRFRTEQQFSNWAVTLERTLTLTERTLRSWTRLVNVGQGFLPMRWFPHPFFPLPPGDEFIRLNIPVTLRDNPGYDLAPSGYIRRKAGAPTDGYFLALDHAATGPVTVLQKHPVVGLVGGTCSYVPAFFPIWGNRNTFSWEPFFERLIAPGQTTTWWIDYDF